jgi:RNA polymerase sigma-70 factor (ECF subfamily)
MSPGHDAVGPVGSSTTAATDDEIVARVAAGELDALEVLYDRYRALAYGIARRITSDPEMAEDVVQEAFLGAWRHAGRYAASRASVKTWLLTIVRNRAIDAVRRRRPSTSLPEPAEATPSALTLPDVWPEIAGRLDRDAVHGALERLPDAQREAIELAYWGGLTQQEIAERTGAPLGTIKSRVRLGLLALRRELGSATETVEPGTEAGA